MPAEDPELIFGCGHSCIFRFHGVGSAVTDGGCHCIDKNMSQEQILALRKKIRELVNYASVLRAALNNYNSSKTLKDIK